MTEILYTRADGKIKADMFRKISHFIAKEKLTALQRLNDSRKFYSGMLGELLLIYLLKQKQVDALYFGRGICYGTGGKPYLPALPGLHFSISHSGSYVACAVSEHPVGIDIESAYRKNIDIFRIAQRVFSDTELELLYNSNASEQVSLFLKLWTQKEAFAKCIGRGLGIFADYRFTPDENMLLNYKNEPYCFFSIRQDEAFYLSGCVNGTSAAYNIQYIDELLPINALI